MAYDNGKLYLTGQGITGARRYVYVDTGGETAQTYKGAGFINDAGKCGADSGDEIHVLDLKTGKQYRGYLSSVSDTGSATAVLADTA